MPLKLPFRFRRKNKVAHFSFYSATWIDELWVRSTTEYLASAGVPVRAVISGDKNNWPAELTRFYRDRNIELQWAPTVSDLHSLSCRTVVTASSGIPRSYFGDSLVHLIHMPHSLASLHTIYPSDAFDGYDTLFAAGPHHLAEFNALGELRGLPPRRGFAVGYGKLDVLRAPVVRADVGRQASKHVLIAPTWGPQNIIALHGKMLVETLLQDGFSITLRPHPSAFAAPDENTQWVLDLASGSPNVVIETSTGGSDALWSADILISDFSGFAFEFAALRKRPVLFCDGPRKTLNEQWQLLNLPAAEVTFRNQIGIVVQPDPARISKAVAKLLDASPLSPESIEHFLFDETHVGAKASDTLSRFFGVT